MPARPPDTGGGSGRARKAGKKSATRSQKPCPICGKPATEAARPFCSDRCRNVDLNRWLSNSYSIPGRENEDEDAD